MAPGVPGSFLPFSLPATVIAAGSALSAEALQVRSLPPVFAITSFLLFWIAVGPSVVASATGSAPGDTAISGGTTPVPASGTLSVGVSGSFEATRMKPVQGLHGAVGVNRTVKAALAFFPSDSGKVGGLARLNAGLLNVT